MKNYVITKFHEILANHYDIGELVHFEEIPHGYVNRSYLIDTVLNGTKERFVFVEYVAGKKEAEIVFEHAMFKHLAERNFGIVPRIVPTTDNKTYLKKIEQVAYENSGKPAFYTVFRFISGQDKYSWINPTCCDGELRSAATVLAKFHRVMFDFKPPGEKCEQIIEFLFKATANIERRVETGGNTVFDNFLRENEDFILETTKRTLRAIDTNEYRGLVNLVIHGDFHPGNMKFDNNQIVGLFDFGWSRVDSRCFDVALALMYFFTSWGDKEDGELRSNEVTTFLDAYQGKLSGNTSPGPLNSTELKYLPDLIHAANIYVLIWTIDDFYSHEVDPYEYLWYLQHSINSMHWLNSTTNRHELQRLISKCEVSH
jgi:homoserine kinase type II